MGMHIGGNKIVRFLGREKAMLDYLRLFQICLCWLPCLPLSREALLGDCLHTMRNYDRY